jgi:HD superfamily phosphodiesterase
MSVTDRLTIYEQLMRLSYVPRWCIIEMRRQQSVAEHTLRVVAMAREAAIMIMAEKDFEVRIDMEYLLTAALTHDAHEAETGDMPMTTKKRLNARNHELFSNPLHRPVNKLENVLVDAADVAESIIEVKRHMVQPKRAEEMATYLKIEMHERLNALEQTALVHRLIRIFDYLIHTAVDLA